MSPIRTITFSTLYPNAAQPSHGIFVENRLRHLLATGAVETRVVAPTPWFPFNKPRFGVYARYAEVPRLERRHGVDIRHPRFITLPKVGMHLAPGLLFAAIEPVLRKITQGGYDFDLIDAHYFYPDGVAAALLAQRFGKPFVVTARGTDINLIADYRLPRRMILWTARQASAVITVCQALKTRLVEIGAAERGIHVLRNGVDLAMFRPRDRSIARARFGADAFTLLSVGHLIARKGHDVAIAATARLPDARLLIAGEGPERGRLEGQAHELGILERISFLGHRPHNELADLYSAADVLVLASTREGWPNVLLEAMACGTPVVASAVWGTPEVVTSPVAGLVVPERSGEAFAAAIGRLRVALPERAATRRYAEGFSWDATTAGQLALFRAALGGTAPVRAAAE